MRDLESRRGKEQSSTDIIDFADADHARDRNLDAT